MIHTLPQTQCCQTPIPPYVSYNKEQVYMNPFGIGDSASISQEDNVFKNNKNITTDFFFPELDFFVRDNTWINKEYCNSVDVAKNEANKRLFKKTNSKLDPKTLSCLSFLYKTYFESVVMSFYLERIKVMLKRNGVRYSLDFDVPNHDTILIGRYCNGKCEFFYEAFDQLASFNFS